MGKKVLFLAQHYITLYAFRRELIEKLCLDGNGVYLSIPPSKDNEYFENIGCKIIPTDIDRRGVNPIKDLRLIAFYRRIVNDIDPDIIFSYTIKPNVYGTIATNRKKKRNGRPFRQICNITGTGGTFLKNDLVALICRILYRHSIRKCYKVFFQNSNDRDMFISNHMVKDNWDMLPGSGVNLKQFSLTPLPQDNDVSFIFIGRVMKLKGIDEFLEAAKRIKKNYPNTKFYIAGFVEEEEYREKIDSYGNTVIPLGFVKDIASEIRKCHCTILPSHGGEGVPNVLLESAAMGRICIGSRVPGTEDVIEDGITGFLFEAGNTDDLVNVIEKILKKSHDELTEMGLAARAKMEREFNREVVINRYIEEVNKA